MKELIEALTILYTYSDTKFPTNCYEGYLRVDVPFESVTEDDQKILDTLGFYEDDEHGGFKSSWFGSN